jgi:hypothetical protein
MKNHLKNDWDNPIERKWIKKYEEQSNNSNVE